MQKNSSSENISFVFFGTSETSVSVLAELASSGFVPSLIVTTPDKPKGRKFILTPSPVKIWADKNNVAVLQPEKLDESFVDELQKKPYDLFIVVAYGKIIPKTVLEIPKYKSINIHYSLLPKLRGSSPIEGAILADEKKTGVTIILMDEKMDHGPIIAQEKVAITDWPPTRTDLMEKTNTAASKLLVETIPRWIKGEITPKDQDHDKATFVKMMKKEDALVSFNDDPYLNFRKIMAYERWPRAYFFDNGKRVVVNKATWQNGELTLTRVTPEGKKEMSFADYKRGLK